MSPQEALQILDQATAAALLPRQAHAQVVEALQVLAALVRSSDPDPHPSPQQ